MLSIKDATWLNISTYTERSVYYLMRLHEIRLVIHRKRKYHNKSTSQYVTAILMNREFSAPRPDEKWCTVITEFNYGVGREV